MLIWWSRLAAMAIVLLPIGGLSYYAQADSQATVFSPCAGWSGLGMLNEPGLMGLVLMGSLWILVRCARRRETSK